MDRDIKSHYVLAAAGVCVAVAVGLAYFLAPHVFQTKTEEDTVTLGRGAAQSPQQDSPTRAPLPAEPTSGTCAQVITRAEDPKSKKIQTFPTPCDVPVGWRILK